MFKLTQEQFIERATQVFGDRYDLSKAVYKNVNTKVCVICNQHGEFLALANNFLRGHGCPECGLEKCKSHLRWDTSRFIEEAKKVHGDRYDYSKVNYFNSQTKVEIICPIHGSFFQKPNDHINGKGCGKCAGVLKSNTKEFIAKAKDVHGDMYDYSLVDYKGNKQKVAIICPQHGVFHVTPNTHLLGHGCPRCSIEAGALKRIIPFDVFVERARTIHGDKYQYIRETYVDTQTKMEMVCPKHGVFLQTPNRHSAGCGCVYCAESSGELFVRKFLEKHNIQYVQQKRFDDCKDKRALPFDFYLPKQNICIEYQGPQHYEDGVFGKDAYTGLQYVQAHDAIKRKYCEENGIMLIEIKYNEKVKDKLNFLISNEGE